MRCWRSTTSRPSTGSTCERRTPLKVPSRPSGTVAVLMVNRYADEAKANSDRRAAELATDGDHAGAAIWRRVTVAIEQLIDTTGPPH